MAFQQLPDNSNDWRHERDRVLLGLPGFKSDLPFSQRIGPSVIPQQQITSGVAAIAEDWTVKDTRSNGNDISKPTTNTVINWQRSINTAKRLHHMVCPDEYTMVITREDMVFPGNIQPPVEVLGIAYQNYCFKTWGKWRERYSNERIAMNKIVPDLGLNGVPHRKPPQDSDSTGIGHTFANLDEKYRVEGETRMYNIWKIWDGIDGRRQLELGDALFYVLRRVPDHDEDNYQGSALKQYFNSPGLNSMYNNSNPQQMKYNKLTNQVDTSAYTKITKSKSSKKRLNALIHSKLPGDRLRIEKDILGPVCYPRLNKQDRIAENKYWHWMWVPIYHPHGTTEPHEYEYNSITCDTNAPDFYRGFFIHIGYINRFDNKFGTNHRIGDIALQALMPTSDNSDYRAAMAKLPTITVEQGLW